MQKKFSFRFSKFLQKITLNNKLTRIEIYYWKNYRWTISFFPGQFFFEWTILILILVWLIVHGQYLSA
jgi:hypothetical protein